MLQIVGMLTITGNPAFDYFFTLTLSFSLIGIAFSQLLRIIKNG